MTLNKNQKIAITIFSTLIVLTLGFLTGKFIYTHEFKWESPVVLQKPLHLVKKVFAQTVNVTVVSTDVDPLTPDQRYACNKFGKDCVTAIAIMRAESHYNNAAYHVNNNGSVDFGCMEINSFWFKQANASMRVDVSKYNLFNCQQNIDVAYLIYKHDGNSFKEWVTYTTGEYTKYLINK